MFIYTLGTHWSCEVVQCMEADGKKEPGVCVPPVSIDSHLVIIPSLLKSDGMRCNYFPG
jgi:hypothetical protein